MLGEDHPVGAVTHWMYFPDEASATQAGDEIRGRGFRVEVRLGAGDTGEWLVLVLDAELHSEGLLDRRREELSAIVEPLGGDYDGNEVRTES